MRLILSWMLLGCALHAPQVCAQAAPHEHGVAHAQLSIDGRDLRISVQLPAADLLGFEHAANTDAQRAKVSALQTTWSQTERWLLLNPAALCTRLSLEVALGGRAHDGDAIADEQDTAGHIDAHIEVAFQCESPELLHELGLNLFALLPDLRTIRYQSIWPSGQGAGNLKTGTYRVMLRSD
jgi:hypothetical protein